MLRPPTGCPLPRPIGGAGVAERFFVTVVAAGAQELRDLQRYDFDLFQATARLDAGDQAAIEGLLTLEQVGQLVKDGYRVVVEDEMEKRTIDRHEVVEFEQWLRDAEEESD